MKYVTAAEAARRIGVSERTVRMWIKDKKLSAYHVEKNRLAIPENEVMSMAAERSQYERTYPDVSALLERIQQLEQEQTALEQRVRALETRETASTPQSAVIYSLPPEDGQKRAYTPRSSERDLPPGAVLAVDFAEQHGVNRRTFQDHFSKGIHDEVLEISSKPNPSRPGKMIRYVTPEDAPRVLDYWKRHNVTYTE